MLGGSVRGYGCRRPTAIWSASCFPVRPRRAAGFLEQILSRMPVPVQAIRVDGSSKFCAEFEQACEEWQIELIVLPPHSPQMNCRVEYAHGTCRREFYECTEMAAELEKVRDQFAQ